MRDNSKKGVAEFEHFESLSNPEDLILVREFIENPNLEENKQKITDFFSKMNVEIDEDGLAEAINNYEKFF